jgi:hypothetical protein
MFFVGRLILRGLHFICNNKLYMFLIVKAFATAYHSQILQYSSSKKGNFNFWHVHTLRSVFVNSSPPKPEVILTNFFGESTVLLVPITSRDILIIHHRRSWHGLTTPLFSNFLFTNLFSIKFLYFFIISTLFPYFNLFVSIFIQSYVIIKLHVSTLYRY